MTFVLIAGIWLNTFNITTLQDDLKKGGCRVQYVTTSTWSLNDPRSCEEIVKLITGENQ